MILASENATGIRPWGKGGGVQYCGHGEGESKSTEPQNRSAPCFALHAPGMNKTSSDFRKVWGRTWNRNRHDALGLLALIGSLLGESDA